MHLPLLQIAYVFVSFWNAVAASHFRGGTVSWKPTGNGHEVCSEFVNYAKSSDIYKHSYPIVMIFYI